MRRRTFLAAGVAMLATSCTGRTPSTPRPTRPPAPLLRRTADRFRPAFHFSPARGNLADPNGLTWMDGEYHLFHQADGRWAHAVSPDRLRWRDLPVALEHDELGQALSGSAIADPQGRTAPADGEPALVALYTSTEGGEAQSLAVGTDRGRTWRRHDGNPVVPNDGRTDFRDPKVLWHEATGRWVMVVSTGPRVSLFGSPDLLAWEHLSDFGDGRGLHSAVWECPDLFELPLDGDPDDTRWVLHVSVGDSDETDGSTAQYFVGSFDGTTFTDEGRADDVRVTDLGQDFYAAQTWSDDPEGERAWIGWMGNWRYPYQAPTGPWRGAMSVPRTLALESRDGRPTLVQRPVDLSALVEEETDLEPVDVDGAHRLDVRGTAYELVADLAWDELDEVGLRVRARGAEGVRVGASPRDGTVFVDRSRAGLRTLDTRDGGTFDLGRRSAPDVPGRRRLRLHVVVDTCSVEVFLDDGLHTATTLVFPRDGSEALEWFTEGGTARVESATFRRLGRIWA